MSVFKVTVASLKSLLIDPQLNLDRVVRTCRTGSEEGSRMVFLPELMLTGHGGHPKMMENAEPIPDGPLCQTILKLSRELDICICVGMAERTRSNVYNSQLVVDRGEYLGLQRKIYLSMDEYNFFAPGQSIEIFNLGEFKFGISICYDNHFPEMALIHGLNKVDLILAPYAGRAGIWPIELTPEFCKKKIKAMQDSWRKTHSVRADDHNLFVLCNNAVGPSTKGLKDLDSYPKDYTTGIDPRDVIANHVGTVMGFDPTGEVFLETAVTDFVDEIITVDIDLNKRVADHNRSRNRQPNLLLRMIQKSVLK